MADPTVDMEFANFEVKFSRENPVEDYKKIVSEKMMANVVMSREIYNACWKKISAATRETVWKLLFDENKTTKDIENAGKLLYEHKSDAGFYRAAEYNPWCILLRDELLKRKMFDFWKNEMVKHELGPCWARDSDLFDDPEDPEPANFYNYAGCEAPWIKEKLEKEQEQELNALALKVATENPEKALKKLSTDSPLEDYKYNMEVLQNCSGDDDGPRKKLFLEARDMIWQFLFGEPTLSAENSKKAADLLQEYRENACFFDPYTYNSWIQKVKNELIKRKYMDFWQNVVVKNELGLCWARDSDYFDDMEDPKPLAFYKLEEDLTNK